MNSDILPSFSIAWFRLQEACQKKEYERVLLNYKLLIHSYESVGYKRQILADLHMLFQEEDTAKKLYYEAFDYYLLKDELFHAAKIILILKNSSLEYLEKKSLLLPELEKNKKKYASLINEMI